MPPALRVPLAALCAGLAPALAAGADPCTCLNWKQVYDSKRALCGEGLEFAFDYPYGPQKTYENAYWAPAILGFTYHEFCGSFFKRMANNMCVNVKHHAYDVVGPEADQWCYVSKDCKELNGGFAVNDQQSIPELPSWLVGPMFGGMLYQAAKLVWPTHVIPRDLSVKLCKSGQDKILGELPPLDVLTLAKSMDSVIGFVTKTAYPVAKRNEDRTPVWEEIKDIVAQGDTARLPAIVRKAVEDKKPIIIDVDPEGHTHQRILVGKEVYELDQACGPAGCGGLQWPFRRARDMGEL